MHIEQCICDEIRPMETRTRLALVWHLIESLKTTNTGRIGLQSLTNSVSYIRGIQDAPADLSALEDPSRRLLVLFPSDDARVLTPELVAEDPRPVTLVVPDGTWGQAKRTVRREAVLAAAPKVIPPQGPPSTYQLRHEHHAHFLSTIEAIARAFGVLEGPEVQAELERVFDIMVARTLETRQMPRTRPRPPGWSRRSQWVAPDVYEAWLATQPEGTPKSQREPPHPRPAVDDATPAPADAPRTDAASTDAASTADATSTPNAQAPRPNDTLAPKAKTGDAKTGDA